MKDAGKKQENMKCINFPTPTTTNLTAMAEGRVITEPKEPRMV